MDDTPVGSGAAAPVHLRARRPPTLASAAALAPAAADIAAMLDRLSGELTAQSDAVTFIADAAEGARRDVARGNRQLEAAGSRPSAMRDFFLTLVALLAVALLFLEWYTP
jgi:hypothetical protein